MLLGNVGLRRGPPHSIPKIAVNYSELPILLSVCLIWGNVRHNGQHACFPCLPPMLECRFVLAWA